MTPAQIKQKLVEDFNVLSDWMDRYDYLIDMGKALPPLDDKYKLDENKIAGCQSDVWLRAFVNDGKIYFEADAGAIITKGLISLLINVYSGQQLQEVANAEMEFIEQIGLKDQLTPTRSNGLMSMLKQIKQYAAGYINQSNQ
jgi:cysteine desulfuration protein SufE